MPEPVGSAPGYRRPVLIVQDDQFNESGISTIVIAAITGNTNIAAAKGNVPLTPMQSGLRKPSVINVSQLLTIDKSLFLKRVHTLSESKMKQVNEGLKFVLSLSE